MMAGFGYVLYFLPPMGDGSLLPSERPYVVPCAYNVHAGEYATGQVPECVRLFSQLHEYPVKQVQSNALMIFLGSVLFTAVNALVSQRHVSSSDYAILAGCEVSAVCCTRKEGASGTQEAR